MLGEVEKPVATTVLGILVRVLGPDQTLPRRARRASNAQALAP
jgi:hypothetical protein